MGSGDVRPGPLPSSAGGRAVAAVVGFYLVWGAFYVARTSFEFEGTRVFLLWDDAMVSMRYARHLFEGHGPVWNPGETPVQGYTNLGLMLAMALVHALPLGVAKMSLPMQMLGVGAAATAVWATAGWVRAAAAASSIASVGRVALGAALACFALGPLAVWAGQGGEGAWIAAWLALLLLGVARAGNGPWPIGLYAWLAVGPVLRLDAGLLAAGVAFASVPGPRSSEGLRHVVRSGAVLAATGLAVLAFGWWIYGDPLPNTYYLKATGIERSRVLWHAGTYVGPWLKHALVPGVLASLALARGGHVPVVRGAAAAVVLGFLYEYWVGGDWVEFYHRLSTPLLVPLAGLAVLGLASLLERSARAPGALVFAIASFVLGATTAQFPATREWLDPRAPTLMKQEARDLYELGRYLRDHTAKSTRVAFHWAGIAPYVSGRPAIDVLGKSDRVIARAPARGVKPGHAKWDWDYVLERARPDLFPVVSRGLDDHPAFYERYYTVARKSDKRLFFVRKEALAKLHDSELEIFAMPGRRRIPPIAPESWAP